MYRIKSKCFVFLLPLLLFCAQHVHAKDAPVLKQLSTELRSIVKETTPAIVYIKAEANAKKCGGAQLDDPMEALQEEFWRQFFGKGHPKNKEMQQKPVYSTGTGFFISGDGFILTNNHIIKDTNPNKISVITTDNKEYKAKLIGGDPNTDVALLKIESKETSFPYLTIGDSDATDVGDIVLAVGNPLGLMTSYSFGIISAKNRTELDIIPIEEFFQIDNAMNRGNSGGALINSNGQVIAMNTAIITTSGEGGSIGIGFSITANILKRVVKELEEHGRVIRGFLGVSLQKVESDIATAFGLNKAEGALVTSVLKDGPAERAGLQSGDIIIRVNDSKVESVGSLRNKISFTQPNEKVSLTLLRDGTEQKIEVTVDSHPENSISGESVENDVGISVEELTPELAQQFGYKESTGVIIKYVAPNSSAARAGLRRGHLILSVNRQPVKTKEQFYTALQATNKDARVVLHVQVEGQSMFVILQPES